MHKHCLVALIAVLLTPFAAAADEPPADTAPAAEQPADAQPDAEVEDAEAEDEGASFKAVPDRPLDTADPVTVAKGHGQIEVGGEFSTSKAGSQLAFPFLVRVGLVDNLELRAGLPAVIVPLSEDTSTELGAIQLAAKVAGNVSDSFAIGALPYFDIAVSSGDETSFSQSTYGVKLLWGWDIVEMFGIGGNFGAAVGPSLEPGDGPRDLYLSATLAASLRFGALRFGLEGFTYGEGDTPAFGTRAAVSYAIFDTFVVDLSGGVVGKPLLDLVELDSTTSFVGLGLTVAR